MKISDFFSESEIQTFKNSKPLLMVSGGADSVFLFHLYIHLREQHNISFEVVHFNHHLRGDESDREEFFVKQLCETHQIVCEIRHLNFEKKSGIQQSARFKRYDCCYDLQLKKQYTHLVTAHHRDDILETLLMRRARGAGLRGLCGIRRLHCLPNPRDPRIKLYLFRPLVFTSKEDILQLLGEGHLSFCEDSSNSKPDYFRNRVRLGLLHSWKEESQKAEIISAIQVLQCVDDYFSLRVDFLSESYSSYVPLVVWKSWPEEIQFRFFVKKMREHGFLHQLERRHFKEFSKDQARLTLNTATCIKDRSSVRFLTNSFE